MCAAVYVKEQEGHPGGMPKLHRREVASEQMHVAARPRRQIKSDLLTIRECASRDTAAVVSMLQDEWLNVFPSVAFDPERSLLQLEFHLGHPKSGQWVLVNPDDVVFGFIGVYVFERVSSGETIACEYWWYVDPMVRGRHGLRLLALAEAWAKARGAQRISIGVHHDKYSRTMERLHYNMATILFEKVL